MFYFMIYNMVKTVDMHKKSWEVDLPNPQQMKTFI